jgi:hypothetical protein
MMCGGVEGYFHLGTRWRLAEGYLYLCYWAIFKDPKVFLFLFDCVFHYLKLSVRSSVGSNFHTTGLEDDN